MTAGVEGSGGGALSVIDRTRVLSESLRQMARTSRLVEAAAVVRGPYVVGRSAKRDLVAPVLVVCLFIIPTLVGALYFGLLASDRYVTDASFALRPAIEPPDPNTKPEEAASSGVTHAMVVQDTKIVAEYITSRRMIEALEQRLPLRAMFSRDTIDYPSRLDATRPVDKILSYWGDRVSVSVASDSELVTVTVNAFTAEESLAIAQAIVAESERMINEFSTRARTKSLEETRRALAKAEEEMTRVRLAQRDLRNKEGVLDGDRTAAATMKTVSELKSQRLGLALRQSTIAGELAPTSRSMQELTAQIRQLDDTVAKLEQSMTAQSPGDRGAFSQTMSSFEALDAERKNAEKYYYGAIAAHERAQIIADRQIEFFSPVAEPVLPVSAQAPRRLLLASIAAASAGALLILVLLARRLFAA